MGWQGAFGVHYGNDSLSVVHDCVVVFVYFFINFRKHKKAVPSCGKTLLYTSSGAVRDGQKEMAIGFGTEGLGVCGWAS